MEGFAVYYILVNIVCVIVFGILLFHNHFSIDRQEKQIKFDHALIASMCYFVTDIFWAAIVSGMVPKTLYTVVINTFLIYLFMVAITYTWLQYVLAVLQMPHRNRRINRFAMIFPFLISTFGLIVHYIAVPYALIDEALDTQPAFSIYLVTVPIIYIIAVLFYTIRRSYHEENPIEKRETLFIGILPVLSLIGGMIQVVFVPHLAIYCCTSMILMLLFYINSMESLISRDPLTNLNNRGQLMRYIAQKANLYIEDRLTYVIMIDVNDFKAINDTYGHAEGDQALIIISDSLKRVVDRHSMPAFLGRYGGDEFILILHPAESREVKELIGEIRDEISRATDGSEKQYKLSVGIGCDELQKENDAVQACISRADKKLYADKAAVKHRGRRVA